MDKLRILVVDDHTVVREGICLLLEAQPDIEVVGEAREGQEALELVERVRPDLVLMDISMPGMNGLEATHQIRSTYPEVKILILTMQEGDEYFFRVLSAGASGYVLKGASSGELLMAIRAVSEGGVFLYPSMTKKLLTEYLQPGREEAGSYDGLTGREKEVLRLIAESKSNQEIADELCLSVNTVQTHRAHIMEKLNLHTRTDLIKYAIRKGLIKVES